MNYSLCEMPQAQRPSERIHRVEPEVLQKEFGAIERELETDAEDLVFRSCSELLIAQPGLLE